MLTVERLRESAKPTRRKMNMAFLDRDEYPRALPEISTAFPMPRPKVGANSSSTDPNVAAVEDALSQVAKFAPPTDVHTGEKRAREIRDQHEVIAKAMEDMAHQRLTMTEAALRDMIATSKTYLKEAKEGVELAAEGAAKVRADGNRLAEQAIAEASRHYATRQLMRAIGATYDMETPPAPPRPVGEQKLEQAAAGFAAESTHGDWAESDEVAAKRG